VVMRGASIPSDQECVGCFRTLPASAFTRASRRPSGRDKYCRNCLAERRRSGGPRRKGCQECRKVLAVEAFPMTARGYRSHFCVACTSRTEKPCRRCGVLQPLEQYARTKHFDGRDRICRTCRRVEREALAADPVFVPATKVCVACELTLPAAAFSRNRWRRDGLQRRCRCCERARRYEHKVADPPASKVCAGIHGCGRLLPREAFSNNRSRPDGKAQLCRQCAYRSRRNHQSWSNPIHRAGQQRYARSAKGILTRLRANARGLEVDLPAEEFIAWYEAQIRACHYCGVKEEHLPDWLSSTRKRSLELDRWDNDRGYVLRNLVLACATCNRLKSDLFTGDEMRWIAEHVIKPMLRAQFPYDAYYSSGSAGEDHENETHV
jgi:hypothetical protein